MNPRGELKVNEYGPVLDNGDHRVELRTHFRVDWDEEHVFGVGDDAEDYDISIETDTDGAYWVLKSPVENFPDIEIAPVVREGPTTEKTLQKMIEFTEFAEDWKELNDILYATQDYLHEMGEKGRLPADVSITVEVDPHD